MIIKLTVFKDYRDSPFQIQIWSKVGWKKDTFTRHREDGPAIITAGQRLWYRDGIRTRTEKT